MTDDAPGAPQLLDTTSDDFLGGALQMQQPRHGYRAGLDAIVLAAACTAVNGVPARYLDCGAGVGVAGLALAWRIGRAEVTLVERDPALAALAQSNATANGLASRVKTVVGDLVEPLSKCEVLAALAGTFDHVFMNPPYHSHAAGTRASDIQKDCSHAMVAGGLEAWMRFAAAMAREGGSLTLIHRAAALPEILTALTRRFGRVWILPLHPRAGEAASRLLVQAVKGSRAPLEILAGRVLHSDGRNGFVPEFDAILRQGAALVW